MLKTKFIEGEDRQDLEQKLNKALEEIDGSPKIQYFENRWMAVIEYQEKPEYEGRLCCDCKFWDDDGRSLANFCTMTGKRTRYNCKACKQFKDLRD